MINYSLYKDEVLVDNIKKNLDTDKCLDILIDRHSGLCVDMINNYTSNTNSSSLRQELINEKNYQIYTSALKYDPSKKTKFTTYLGNEIKWKCLNIYNKMKNRKTIPVEEDLINYFSYTSQDQKNEKSEPDTQKEIFSEIINAAKQDSDKRVGRIFHLRYIVGKNNSVMPWKNVSEDLGMSIQGCINIHDSAIKKIKNRIE